MPASEEASKLNFCIYKSRVNIIKLVTDYQLARTLEPLFDFVDSRRIDGNNLKALRVTFVHAFRFSHVKSTASSGYGNCFNPLFRADDRRIFFNIHLKISAVLPVENEILFHIFTPFALHIFTSSLTTLSASIFISLSEFTDIFSIFKPTKPPYSFVVELLLVSVFELEICC